MTSSFRFPVQLCRGFRHSWQRRPHIRRSQPVASNQHCSPGHGRYLTRCPLAPLGCSKSAAGVQDRRYNTCDREDFLAGGRAPSWKIQRRFEDLGTTHEQRRAPDLIGGLRALGQTPSDDDVRRILAPYLACWERQPRIITGVLSRLGQEGRSNVAAQVVRVAQTQGAKVNVFHYSAAINACGKAGQWKQAMRLFCEMIEKTAQRDSVAYGAAISACEKGGQWRLALGLLSEMKQHLVTRNTITYSATISACEKVGQWGWALALLDAMVQDSVLKNGIAYSATISACEKGGQWQLALLLLSEIDKSRIKRTTTAYNAAISACEKGGEWRAAVGLLLDMSSRRVETSTITYSATISACKEQGMWEIAIGLLALMSECMVAANAITYNAAISTCGTGKQWQYALALAGEMSSGSLLSDAVAGSVGTSACAKDGTQASTILEESSRRVPEKDVITHRVTLTECEKGRQWQMALAVFSAIPTMQADEACCNAVFDAVYDKPIGPPLFAQAVQRRVYSGMLTKGRGLLDLHGLSHGAAVLAVHWWLQTEVPVLLWDGAAPFPRLEVITGWGRSRRDGASSEVRDAIAQLFTFLRLPQVPTENPGRLALDGVRMREWLQSHGRPGETQ